MATSSAPCLPAASVGCDKPTRGPRQSTSLCKTGHPVVRRHRSLLTTNVQQAGQRGHAFSAEGSIRQEREREGEGGREALHEPAAAAAVEGCLWLRGCWWKLLPIGPEALLASRCLLMGHNQNTSLARAGPPTSCSLLVPRAQSPARRTRQRSRTNLPNCRVIIVGAKESIPSFNKDFVLVDVSSRRSLVFCFLFFSVSGR